ncbi:MAG: dephospho-CoA kinase [Gaiellaceae bacterium]|nr:dephospho-CoA kinase [Gaiellaceae bacterium]
MPRPLAVAITGGIGAGKSEALKAFARQGAATVSSDEIVHRLYTEDDEVRRAVLERLGPEVLDAEGRLDRAAIAPRVFGDAEQLAWLEGLLHPRVAAAQEAWRAGLAGSDDPPALAVVEIPLLYETGAEERFDAVVVVTAPAEVRAQRTKVLGDGRETRLIPDEEKIRRADFAYVNDAGLDGLDAFVGEVVAALEPRAG